MIFFTGVGEEISNSVPPVDKEPEEYIEYGRPIPPLQLGNTTPEHIIKIIKKFQPKSSCDVHKGDKTEDLLKQEREKLIKAVWSLKREISYLSYRGVRDDIGGGRARNGVEYYGKTRLDFFLVDNTLMEYVKSVRYEDRLSADFDHKEVSLIIGKTPPAGKITIYDSTLSDSLAESIGILALFDT